MADSIQSFLSGFKNPAKTNLYKLTIFPEGVAKSPEGNAFNLRAKGSQLPTSDINIIEIPYKGRKVKVPGERTFAEWTVTVMETAEMGMRKRFEEWISAMDAPDTITRNTDALSRIHCDLLQPDNSTIAMRYVLYGAFPTSIASVDLTFDEQTAPLEYSVTFQYSYHTIEN